ncbi:MAG: cyanophycinase [Ginsengibacter sp.]
MMRRLLLTGVTFLFVIYSFGQAKGKLFIIGGGDRSPHLIQTLIVTAQLSAKDYIVVLPMSTEEPDTAYYYIKTELEAACRNPIINMNFTKNDTSNTKWLDSLEHARLIFITGGDQTRFMDIVLHTPIQRAILKAYKAGATVAGTSAGAAMMSSHMITGNNLLGDTTYHATFKQLRSDNIEIEEGLGLLTSAIVDQHFIVRSRYNRLLSALAKYPRLPCIGIDEATAIIIQGKDVKVTGESQVIVFSNPAHLRFDPKGHIKFDDLHMSIYTQGDNFQLSK